MNWNLIFKWLPVCAGFLVSCVTTEGPAGYDKFSISIGTLDLFSQMEAPKTGKSWAGDWQFRRDRLELIDSTLRDIRPDILLLQNVMRRSGSVSESDELILKSASLSRFDWREVKLDSISETGEDRLMALAAARPFKILGPAPEARNSAKFGVDGNIVYQTVETPGGPLLVFNVQMPSKIDQAGLWYSLLEDQIRSTIKTEHGCLERVIVGGYLPFEQESRRFKEFLSSLKLKDTGTGFCQNAERCQTATNQNGLFQITRGDQSPSQLDRVLVNQYALVYAAGANFTRSVDSMDYKELYGINRIWAAQRYGWVTTVKLPICP